MYARLGQSILYFIFILSWTIFIQHWKREKISFKTYNTTKYLTFVLTASLWIAMLMMIFSFVSRDYSFVVVFENVDNEMSLFDRIMATWAARPGSMMLWAVVQSTITIFVLSFVSKSYDLKFHKRLVSILLFFNALVISFAISVREPTAFGIQDLAGINDGLGLTPSLRNFWQQIHPPIAFLSYSAFIVPYAVGLSGLMNKDDEEISEEGRWLMDFFMLVGWVFTSIFIIAGSIWSYEVDWGGLWFFDGVQTSSFILWIMASSYFHLKPLMNKDYPIHLFTAALGWIGVTIAALIVRGGFLEGPHTYSGNAQRVVFGLLMLGTIFGLYYAVSRQKKEIIPEWLFDFKLSKNKYSLLTVWLLGIIIIVNLTSITLQIVYVQLENDLGDLTSYYRIINGILLTALVLILLLCENDSIRPPKNFLKISFITGLAIILTWGLIVFNEIRLFAFLLLLLVGASLITQLSLILFTVFYKRKNRKVHLRLTHFVIILTLFSYFVTDPHTVEVQTILTQDKQVAINKLDLKATLIDIQVGNISNNEVSKVLVELYDSNNDSLGILTLKQGIYRGQPWSKGDWITRASIDIYVKLTTINLQLFITPLNQISIIVKTIPGINIFRANIVIFSFIGIVGIAVKWRTKPSFNQIS